MCVYSPNNGSDRLTAGHKFTLYLTGGSFLLFRHLCFVPLRIQTYMKWIPPTDKEADIGKQFKRWVKAAPDGC